MKITQIASYCFVSLLFIAAILIYWNQKSTIEQKSVVILKQRQYIDSAEQQKFLQIEKAKTDYLQRIPLAYSGDDKFNVN